MIIDTTFLVDLMRGDEDAVAKAAAIERALRQQRLSSMTLFELYYGVERSNQPERERTLVEEVLASKPVRPADTVVMRKAGRIAGEDANDGESIGDGDTIVAATAQVVDEPVLTRNERDFTRVDDLDVETY